MWWQAFIVVVVRDVFVVVMSINVLFFVVSKCRKLSSDENEMENFSTISFVSTTLSSAREREINFFLEVKIKFSP
jgi:hypothetical protein